MYRNHRETRPLFGEAEIRTRDGRSREGTLTTAPPFYIDHRTVRLAFQRRGPFHRTCDRTRIRRTHVTRSTNRSHEVTGRDAKTQSFTVIHFLYFFIFSQKPCKPKVPMLLGTFAAYLEGLWLLTSKKKFKTGALNENNYR